MLWRTRHCATKRITTFRVMTSDIVRVSLEEDQTLTWTSSLSDPALRAGLNYTSSVKTTMETGNSLPSTYSYARQGVPHFLCISSFNPFAGPLGCFWKLREVKPLCSKPWAQWGPEQGLQPSLTPKIGLLTTLQRTLSVLQLGEARPGKVEIMYFTIIYPKPHLNFVAPLSLKLLPPTTVPNVISFFSISTVSFKNNKQTTKPQLPITWWRILQSKYAVRHTIKFKSLIIINKKA